VFRKALVFEIIDGDGGWLMPEVERLFAGFGHDGLTMGILPVNGKRKNIYCRMTKKAPAVKRVLVWLF